MAYNVLKGAVEGSVDQHGDQEISGIKIFKSTISASVFYDTDAESPCATMKDVAITKLIGTTPAAVLTFEKEGCARAHHGFTYSNNTLTVASLHAGALRGDGSGITSITAHSIKGRLRAEQINAGPGLIDVRGRLQIKTGLGLETGESGVSIALNPQSGLTLKSNKLSIDPSQLPKITDDGQNLSDSDLLIVGDLSRNSVVNTTLSNLYDKYLKTKIAQSAGEDNSIQFKVKGGFGASPQLSYEPGRETLKVAGALDVRDVKITGNLNCHGAIVTNIKTVTTRVYEVSPTDHTILCDTLDNPIDVLLPPACNHAGRILTFKKANSNKYKINSYPVVLRVAEGTIDLNKEISIKTNYALRSVQSDGDSWWIIGVKGN